MIDVKREYLLFLPDWTLYIMYPLAFVALGIMVYGLNRRLRVYGLNWKSLWRELRTISKKDGKARLLNVWKYALVQSKLLRVQYAGIFHWLIYGSMLVLVIGTILVFLDQDFLTHVNLRIVQNEIYFGFELFLDTFAVLLLVGILMALWRRLVIRPKYLASNPESYLILLLILYLGIGGIVLEGIRLTLRPVPWADFSYLGNLLAKVISSFSFNNQSLENTYQFLWWTHMLAAFCMIALFPFTKLFHILAIPLNIFLLDPQKDKAKLSTPFNVMELAEDDEAELKVGIQNLNDLDWKRKLELDACINCGRCERICPANAAGRELSPRLLIQGLRKELTLPVELENSFFDRGAVTENSVWSCTNCAACMEECPALINHVEYILDLRRQLVSDGKIDEKQTALLTCVDRNSNPYGLPSYQRTEWLTEMGIPSIADFPEAEYIYWIGCAGSYDDRAKNIVLSTIKLLEQAAVPFAIFGEEEKCCGELVKRLGEEGRFQLIAMQNLELLQQYSDKKIITSCPHCYNTLNYEYRDFGPQLDVIHHTQLLYSLIKDHRIKMVPRKNSVVTYHDPCNLGRLNGTYEEPREILRHIPGVILEEAPRNRDQGFCCGAGGDNAWYTMPEKDKISSLRIREINASTHAEVLMVACPYCASMFEDAVKTEGLEQTLLIKDIAEFLAEHTISEENTAGGSEQKSGIA